MKRNIQRENHLGKFGKRYKKCHESDPITPNFCINSVNSHCTNKYLIFKKQVRNSNKSDQRLLCVHEKVGFLHTMLCHPLMKVRG